jgi:hypothetical protein
VFELVRDDEAASELEERIPHIRKMIPEREGAEETMNLRLALGVL